MTKTDAAFLNIVKSALHDKKPEDPALTAGEWSDLFRTADAHKLLPLVLDASISLSSLRKAAAPAAGKAFPLGGRCQTAGLTDEGSSGPSPAAPARSSGHSGQSEESVPAPPDASVLSADVPDLRKLREYVFSEYGRQVIQENEFLNLVLALRERGLEPLILKGPILRALYPKPLLRPSVDDDLLIRAEDHAAFRTALLELGMTADEPEFDAAKTWESSYHKQDSPLYIELHVYLFEPDSPVFSGFNACFADVFDAPVRETVQDVALLTPAPERHLLFLILHAYKHFLHSGFGLRIVSDVCLFSQAHREEIDFSAILRTCEDLRCGRFAAALYAIGEKYLDLPAPEAFAALNVDERPLLEDVLTSGLHGQDINRLHSARITLQTVARDRTGQARSGGLRASLFPSRRALQHDYPYLKRRPWLLPAAWTSRIFGFCKYRLAAHGGIRPTASLRIGKERVALLEEYGVVDRK